MDEAEILVQKILATKPNDLDALNSYGLILLQQERFDDAIKQFSHALEVRKDDPNIIENLVRAVTLFSKQYMGTNQHNLAEKLLRSMIVSLPENSELYCHLSFILSQSGKCNEALAISETALEQDQENPHCHDVKGLAFLGLGRLKSALSSFRQALKINPKFVSARVNLSSVLLELKDYEVAIDQLEQAKNIEPKNPQIFNNLGLAYAGKAKFEEAEKYLRIAIKMLPEFAEAHFNLSRILLMQGNYKDGWQENEWRWKCKNFPSTWRDFPYPYWQGENVRDKTILVWSEQGIGDEIMFSSVIPDLLADGAKLIFECGERLAALFDRSFRVAVVVSRKNPPDNLIQQSQIDYQLPIASLCTHYRNSKEAFQKAKGPYLSAEPARVIKLRDRYLKSGKKPLVGICWRSGNPIAGAERSAPLANWDKVLLQPNCKFVSLQYGEVKADLEAAKKRLGVQVYHDELIDPLKDAEDWFAQVAAMDLVVSVDNSTIQVSGSQGINTWVLLSSLPEWRFGIVGSGHDWHTTAKVYRQPTKGGWKPVIDMLAVDLRTWLANTEFNL